MQTTPPESPPCFVLVAGEASGDQLGAGLIASLAQHYPEARFVGIGGPAMAEADCDLWWDYEELAVMGLVEVLRHLPRLLKLKKNLIKRTIDTAPACYIGIDAPDFNLRVSHKLKQAGIRTVQYVSPTVWAWRPKRVKVIRRSVHRVLCLYPFEPEFFAGHGVDARYVGHPMADRLHHKPERTVARNALKLNPESPWIALLPGSRSSEIARLGPLFAHSIGALSQRFPNLQWVTAMANERTRTLFFEELEKAGVARDQVHFLDSAAQALEVADFALAASGTVTLEAALIGRPTVVAYKLARTTYFVLRSLGMLKLERVALPNILLDDSVVPELLQEQATVANIVAQAGQWLSQPEQLKAIEARFESLHPLLACNANEQSAAAIVDLLEGQ